jgi:TolB protein
MVPVNNSTRFTIQTLFLVSVIFQSAFAGDSDHSIRIKIVGDRDNAARVTIVQADGTFIAPDEAIVRTTSHKKEYFYADGEFTVQLPDSPVRMTVAGGLESIPRTLLLNANTNSEVTVELDSWIDLNAQGWYSGDSHVHLHTGGPITVTISDAMLAARAEGLNYLNLCVSNNLGDDIRDPELISGRPDAVSTDRQLLVFGEEMRSAIYGHMQFFGIHKFVEPQYTGFDNTPHQHDFPANYTMAKEACDQGGLVTYGHPMLQNAPDAFGTELTASNGAARELPIDVVHGVVQAMDIMSYNSDEELSAELWYRLLNCGLKISACVGTDALLDNSTDPLGGSRVYVKTSGAFTMASWLEGLKQGRTFVTNGPILGLTVNGQELGSTCQLESSGTVRVSAIVDSLVPVSSVELIVNGEVVKSLEPQVERVDELQHVQWETDVPVAASCWVALRVRGPDDPRVFDGPTWAHTSPVYVEVAGQKIASSEDAQYFVGWIEQMLRVVAVRNRYPSEADREQVQALFREAQDYYRAMTN